MTNALWLNIPLCAIAFFATVGIPMRLVLTDPDRKAGNAKPNPHTGDGRLTPASGADISRA